MPLILTGFKLVRVLVRLDHVVSIVVQANHFVVAVWRAKSVDSLTHSLK
jgi:hypothetical protein